MMFEADETNQLLAPGSMAVSEVVGFNSARLIHECIEALHRGEVCLHPTDTLPGLAFDPRRADALRTLAKIKGRDESKTCLALAASLAEAERFFAPLPAILKMALAQLWPGPLSVVYRASALTPKALVSQDGTVGLRVPELPRASAWLYGVMRAFGQPLPTTSVNASGTAPEITWDGAAKFLTARAEASERFLPPKSAVPTAAALAPKPSTLVRVLDDGGYIVLRQGAMARDMIDQAFARAREELR